MSTGGGNERLRAAPFSREGGETAHVDVVPCADAEPGQVSSRRLRRRMGIKGQIILMLSLVLLVLLAVESAWTYHSQDQAMRRVMLEESRILVAEMDAVWEFVSANQDTINYTSDGVYDYKGLHCAIAGKAVAAFFSENSDYTIRFTKLDPRNLRNRPDEFEVEALNAFDGGEMREYYGFSEYEGKTVFRYASALEVSENCIECHGGPAGQVDPTGYEKEGWAIGHVAGAVSVVVPTELHVSNMVDVMKNNALFFITVFFLIAVAIYLSLTFLVTSPLANLSKSFVQMSSAGPSIGHESSPRSAPPRFSSPEISNLFLQFETMADSLASLYSSLELQVEERTERLSEAVEELERQRRHVEHVNEQLEKESLHKSDFLAIVSHELRTPLTSILAFADLLKENVPADNVLAQQQIDEIGKNGAILLEMVNNVLETARIQAGFANLNLELIDLNDVVGMVEASNKPLALKKSIEYASIVAADVPLIRSDWEKVRQVLANLVSNAIRFTSNGGHVTVEVVYLPAEDRVRINVIDDGIGIPSDKHDLIFERFTQENMSTVRRYGGSGLGLSLVKDLVGMLGGSVSLVSELGKGSVFTVTLPVKLQEVP